MYCWTALFFKFPNICNTHSKQNLRANLRLLTEQDPNFLALQDSLSHQWVTRKVQGLVQQHLSPLGYLTDSTRDGNFLSNEGWHHTPQKHLEGQKTHSELKAIELSDQHIGAENVQELEEQRCNFLMPSAKVYFALIIEPWR